MHHDRRLHQLMLAEEVKAWDRQYAAAAAAIDGAAPAADPACCAERAAEAPADPEEPCFSGRGDPVPAPARRAAAAAGVALVAGPAGELAAGAAVMASPADSASSLHGGLLCAGEDAGAMYRCDTFCGSDDVWSWRVEPPSAQPQRAGAAVCWIVVGCLHCIMPVT